MRGTAQRDQGIGDEGGGEELRPVDTNMAQPADIAADEHGNSQGPGDNREKQEHSRLSSLQWRGSNAVVKTCPTQAA